MSDFTFKQVDKNEYETFMEGKSLNIFFNIPPECKMEDYNIVIVGQKLVSSSRAHFTLNNRPENMGQIKINSEADIHFENNINIKVGKQLEIGKNNNLVINSYSKTSLYFDELLITNNTNTEINLVAEGPRKAAVDYRQIPISMSSIRNNNFCIFNLGTNVKKIDFSNNSSTSQDIPFRLSVARADYAIIDGNQVTPTSEDAIIMADVTGGFNLRHAQMTINGKNQIRNDYVPPMDGMFPFTTIRDCAPTFDNSVVETSAISLTVAASSNVVPISFKDEVKLNTERDAKISGQNSLENIVVTCQYESIHLDSNGKIKDSQIEFYTKQDASTYGRTIIGSKFTNAKITNIADDLSLFVDRVGVDYAPLVCDKIQMNSASGSDSRIKIITNNSSEVEINTKIPIYLENIKLDSKACLEVNVNSDLSKEVSIPVEFKNTNFNQYNFFETDNGLSVENSSFKGLRLISTHDDKEAISKIDNSMCKDVIRLHNISKVSFSEISNTDISNNKEVEVSNEFIKDQRIGDYEEFAKSRQARDNFDKDTSITEDLEVL